jgi:hypothetical protein
MVVLARRRQGLVFRDGYHGDGREMISDGVGLGLVCFLFLHAIQWIAHGGVPESSLHTPNIRTVTAKLTPSDTCTPGHQASSDVANATKLHQILALYEVQSGQMINKSKSSELFSKGTKDNMKQVILNVLDIPRESRNERYFRPHVWFW